MIMFKESQVLDEKFRAQVIKEILGDENQARKREHYKRYEIYNDKVSKYTEDLLRSYFDNSTVDEMKLSLSNVSLCRKIVDKLARVYSYGVNRIVDSKRDQKKLDELEVYLKFNYRMKKANRYLKLHNNIWVTCLPKPIKDANGNVLHYELKLSVLPPFLFDVIEDADDRESASCLILSNFNPKQGYIKVDQNRSQGIRGSYSGNHVNEMGDGRDQIIADTPYDFDPKNQRFTFWTNSFHLTCDAKGVVVDAPLNFVNPIEIIPGVALNKDQDGQYYSISGSDLVDSCLLSNAMITNVNHIGIQQGYGQAYMIGKELPEKLMLGPTKVVKIQVSDENEKAEFGFANSSAPLAELKELVIMQIALLLSTNNLSTKGVKTNLDSGMDFPSGVAAMIDKAESTEDVKDQAQVFVDSEIEVWKIAMAWLDLYGGKELLSNKLSDKKVFLDSFQLKINDPAPIVSEGEKLDNLKKRDELGINTKSDLIMMDNPEMTQAEVDKKLLEIVEERAKNMMAGLDNEVLKDEEDVGEPGEQDEDPGE